MKKTVSFTIFLLIQSFVSSQEIEDAWVYFKDKPSSNTYLSNPISMLTQRAIDRRSNQSIPIDMIDVPLEANYVNAVDETAGITVKARSKWLNALHVQGTKAAIDLLINSNGVAYIDYANKAMAKSILKNSTKKRKFSTLTEVVNLEYGATQNQISMLGGDYLHNLGFTGKGYQIAIIDAGFKGVETFAPFSRLQDQNLENGEVLGGYDFVNRSTNFYVDTGNTHGLSVLSTIGAYADTEFIGTAPDANFYLFITEDGHNETPLEESLWVEAAERADSLGVDIINTSLGYTTFDNGAYNYNYADMDGETTFISRGAEIAATRGMVIVTSAGNSGASSWHYIGAPADAKLSITVGAVNASEQIASFSSFGPSADNRVKPEILAQGQNVYVINGSGNVATSNGTSFSSPIISGMVACLWQAFPNKTAFELKELIVASSNLISNPTDQKGYGIPDFKIIYESLHTVELEMSSIAVFPNPVIDVLYIDKTNSSGELGIQLYDFTGKLMLSKKVKHSSDYVDVSRLSSGIYFVHLLDESQVKIVKIIKQ